ncbi:3-(3-hydroxyphenyl)propionate hydroxylase [Sphingomonas sp. Root710]|uniref:bifunctional 3-(3-hydroxy-phenyl)propionate/3-hydroxycinnamic acid hydroxylase MhpA n=1 Tax=Sphingomonas sp. Root710 TaxID=1736594 RepID=UPI0006FB09C1|nr:bifunctional 3-(3-hydroxy-phenyl)propionate/3-hydroxycinnamic acid hydroxylase [Sphingomonas sp. Root710]KRB82217.1 3-(3-hydroxyphenyl)propionate hydroxylase [Sphingomonas sp. Root710]
MTHASETFDVAIIGFGPSGATLAHLLGISGLRVLVLERDGAAYHFPRAVHFDDEVMRVFQTVGLGDSLSADIRVNLGMRFVDSEGRMLLDWSRPQEIGRHGWHASYRFHQPTLERLLNEGIARHPDVDVRRRCEAFLIDDRGDHAVLRYEDMATGKIVEVRAGHVVGCDGARSLVRRFIGTEMEDLGFHERWLVVDALLKTPRPDLGDHSIQYCDPQHPVTYARQPGDRRRWEIRLRPEDDERTVTAPDRIWSRLARWITPADAELERVATYTFHSLVAKQWRRGRLWIAGDSAHQTPPFMGQGMCAGIRDVANLAWKLALAVRGQADEALLDSYQSERQPNVRDYITTAVRLGGLINASDPEAALRLAQPSGDGGSRMESPVSRLGPGLGSGPHRGQIFGQPRLNDGRLMDDAIGYAPVLVADAALLSGLDAEPGVAVVTTDDAQGVAADLADLGVRAVLLRPDRYILATATDLAGLKAMLATL